MRLGCDHRRTSIVIWTMAVLFGSGPYAQAHPVSHVITEGGRVFGKWCGDCHTSPTGPGSLSLQRKYQGTVPAILEQRNDLSPEYISLVVRRGISFMPSFRKTEISDSELQILTDYLINRP